MNVIYPRLASTDPSRGPKWDNFPDLSNTDIEKARFDARHIPYLEQIYAACLKKVGGQRVV